MRTRYVDWLCESFANQDRAALARAEMECLRAVLADLRAAEAEEVRTLQAEVARLEAD